jgi:eukaryotic-like serine/threonine-protein kinase
MTSGTKGERGPTKVGCGDVIAGKYRVERVLGAGGMGIVVAATHLDLLEVRALKLLLDDTGGDEATERFLREARAASRLKSERVIRVHDVGRLESGVPYLVMEYLEGRDLGALLNARGPLPAMEAVAYVLQILEGMAEAHAAGIVHRDLKPANVFITTGANGSACVKILDFGISKLSPADAPTGTANMTRTDVVLGSPHYMSPEQMRSTRSVDPRADIWSIGVILYKLLTGTVPFPGETVTQVCIAVVNDAPCPPSSLNPALDPRLDDLILRCLEKDPEQRFADVSELAAALLPFGPPGSEASLERTRWLLGAGPPPAALSSGAWPSPVAHVPSPDAGLPESSPASSTASSWGTTRRTDARVSSKLLVMGVLSMLALGGAGALVVFSRPFAGARGASVPRSEPRAPAATVEVATSLRVEPTNAAASATPGGPGPAPTHASRHEPSGTPSTQTRPRPALPDRPSPRAAPAQRPASPPADPFGTGRN